MNKTKLKVIVADDMEILAQNIISVVKKNENVENVLYAKNGREELNMILDNAPDIVFTDMQMPEMTGIEVIKTIKEMEMKKKPKFILVTSDRDYDLVSKSRELNFDIEYKPIKAERVNDYINSFNYIEEISHKIEEKEIKEKIGKKENFMKKLLKNIKK